MKRITLPTDIQKYVSKRVTARIALCVLIELAVAAFLFFLGEWLFAKMGPVSQYLIYAILMLLPFYFTGVPLKLLDHAWCATVTRVKIKTRMGFTNDAKPKMYVTDIIELTMRDESGNVFAKEVKRIARSKHAYVPTDEIGKLEQEVEDWKVGDTVYHFYGLSEYFVLRDGKPATNRCIVCGTENKEALRKCWHCGHTLLKP